MSRIGNLPINVPSGVSIDIKPEVITVKGPKGELVQNYGLGISFKLDGSVLTVIRANEEKQTKAAHGLYRSLVSNMIEGTTKGFSKKLEIIGTGYRAEVKGNNLILSLGYSSPIWYEIEKGITIEVEAQTKLTISGISKERVGQIASEIRSLRAPEPYKGKGIKYSDETIKRKVGKSGKSSGKK